ncbi:amphi-Trp domain-containing protein [Roseibium hamelinense]|uniref:Amphi-Trp domain-containing protein n=1 Tax=Roseibium hamelinense TaxID=150831 RepID=A0A562TGX8_9HYPH|nr:amphi-Trp domain-containing protein [Roseibium hamelinense]MTI45944.1 amphi-Trp domain-containing protein [Roseibium hamelinense]TWI92871.1 amphi-Trp domain-containing protein [Roseibium hamelinense]
MMERKDRFRHESLQDKKSIQQLLNAISKGIAKGEISFSDEEGGIVLEPDGLMNLKVTASNDDNRCRIDVRVTWTPETNGKKDTGKLKVKA